MTGVLFRLRGMPMIWKVIVTTLVTGSGSGAMVKSDGDILLLDQVGTSSQGYGIEDRVTTRGTN